MQRRLLLRFSLRILLGRLLFANSAHAICDENNLGQWEIPTKIGPEKEVPGFLVHLGPTGAMAIALGAATTRLRIQGVGI